MIKEKVFEFLEVTINKLIHTDIIMYPAGSVRKEEGAKIGNTCEYIFIDNKPEFIDIRDYRKSLLELITKLIDFYKEI